MKKETFEKKESTKVDQIHLRNLLMQKDISFLGIKTLGTPKIETEDVSPWKCNITLTLKYTTKFIIHFVIVMFLLYLSAYVFAYLEDPKNYPEESNTQSTCRKSRFSEWNTSKETPRDFVRFLEVTNNISLSRCDQVYLFDKVGMFLTNVKMKKAQDDHDDKEKLHRWFYFVIIATTTIGYGDIHPHTDRGKLFYIFFSVIGIILMMSLLKAFGRLFINVNNYLQRITRHILCREVKAYSEELSIMLNAVLFIIYLSFGIWHDTTGTDGRSLIDIIYYWIVTFTTVGFGDIGNSLDFEIKHWCELTIYRLFGLAMVAAIIESIQTYVVHRRKSMELEVFKEKQMMALEKIISQILSQLSGRRHCQVNRQFALSNGLKESLTFLQMGVDVNDT